MSSTKALLLATCATLLACGEERAPGGSGDEPGGGGQGGAATLPGGSASGGAASGGGSGEPDGSGAAPSAGGGQSVDVLEGDGSAVVSLVVTVGERRAVLSHCKFATGTALLIRQNQYQDTQAWQGELECAGAADAPDAGMMVVSLLFFDAAVGSHEAADLSFVCDQFGCSGTARVVVRYVDADAGLEFSASTATASSESGSFTLTSYAPESGLASGELDLSLTAGAATFTVEGTFSADLRDCTGLIDCSGEG